MASKNTMKMYYWSEMYVNGFAVFEILRGDEAEMYKNMNVNDLPENIVLSNNMCYRYTVLLSDEQIDKMLKMKTYRNSNAIKIYIAISFWLSVAAGIITVFSILLS